MLKQQLRVFAAAAVGWGLRLSQTGNQTYAALFCCNADWEDLP